LTFNATRHIFGGVSDNRGSEALRAIFVETKQVVLAKKTGLSQSFLSRLAGGKKPQLREDALALAKAGIPIDWWDQPPKNPKRSRERRNPAAAE
jgi:hypothetical protein